MENNEQVKVTSEKSIATQFGKGTLYHVTDKQNQKRNSLLGTVAVMIAVSIGILKGSPQKEKQSDGGFSPPETTSQSNPIDLPLYSYRDDEAKNKGEKNKGVAQKIIKYSGPKLIGRPKLSAIPPGAMIEAVLTTGASNGPGIRAKSTKPLIVGGEVIFQEGALFLGQGQSTDEGLVVQFTKIVFDDGSSQTIQAVAADFEDKIPRLRGSKVGQYALKLATSAGLNFLSGMSDGFQENDVQGGVAVNRPTVKNALLNGTSQAALDLSNETLSSIKDKAPVVEIKVGTPIYITFD